MEQLDYTILHDTGKSLCFIGNSFMNHQLYNYFKSDRDCKIITYEDVLTKNQNWIDNHQFITTVAEIKFKKLIVDSLSNKNLNYFSVCAKKNHIGFNVNIGKGSFICDFNTILDDATIGNHTVITTHSQISHCVTINDFCHVGPFSQFMFATINSGCYISARSSFIGKKSNILSVANYCNFIIGSTITKEIAKSGTYFGNRCINNQTSLDTKID